MNTLKIGAGVLCVAAVLCSSANPAAASNLVVNGGFESANLNNGRWTTYGEGQLEGWTPTSESRIEIRNNVAGTAYEGNHYAELDSHYYNKNAPEIGLFQDIATEIGQKYTLSFAYGPREQRRVDGDNKLSVSFAGFYQELDAGNSTDGWQTFSQTITATAETTRLKFLSLGKRDTLGANIDDVSLEVADVPEPFFVLGLAAVGCVGAAGAIRKRVSA